MKSFTLANGLRVLMVPMPGLQSVTVLAGVAAGSRNETPAKAGLFHFLEHMAFKGTKKRPTPAEVAKVVDSIGGENNAGTSKEFTEYWAKAESRHLERLFDFWADNLRNPIFAVEQIEKEKHVVMEEINLYEDLPMRRVSEVFESLVYGETSLGRDIAGKKETVAKIERNDFVNYLRRFYFPRNMVLAVAGSFKETAVRRLAKKYFGDWAKRPGLKREKLVLKQTAPRLKVVYKKTDQAHFCLGVPGVSYGDRDRFAVSVMASLLGYSRSSRMYQRVREERGLAYYVRTEADFNTDVGLLVTQAGVSLEKIEEAMGLVLGEYRRLTEETVGAGELQQAKDYLRGQLILSLEDSFNMASHYAVQALLEGRTRSVEEILAAVDKVTAADIRRVAGRLLRPEKMNLALIGPYKKEESFKKLLKG